MCTLKHSYSKRNFIKNCWHTQETNRTKYNFEGWQQPKKEKKNLKEIFKWGILLNWYHQKVLINNGTVEHFFFFCGTQTSCIKIYFCRQTLNCNEFFSSCILPGIFLIKQEINWKCTTKRKYFLQPLKFVIQIGGSISDFSYVLPHF